MQSKLPADRAPTPGCGKGPGCRLRAEAAPASQPSREDDRPGAGQPGADLPESERFYRATFERAVIGIAHLSPKGRVLRVNQRLCDLLGYGRAELAALTIQDLTHPDDRDASVAQGRRLLAGEIEECELDKRFIRKDGALLWVHLTVALVQTPAGAPDYFITMVQDITARKRLECERARLLARERAARLEAEAARVQAEHQADQLDRIFEAAADGLAVGDAQGRLVRDNAAARRIMGLDAAPPDFLELSALEQAAFFPGRDEQDHPLAPEEFPVIRALQGKVVSGAEARDLRGRALDGREIEVNLSAAPLWDREGHLVGVVSVLHDLTERNRLAREREAARADELAAREASRRMEEFLAVAAHDLRTPLTATLGYLDLAESQFRRLAAAAREESPVLVPRVESVRGHLGEAGQSAERLARLITLLFDTAAIRAGQLELRRTPHDLAALVGQWVAEQRVAAPGRAIRLHTPPDGAPIPVEADADRLGQVVSNYLTNALKYSPPDRPVDVSVAVRVEGGEGQAHVAVRDRGPGIPEVERGRVWELFHRAPGMKVQDRARGGSLGLGLYISKAIVEAHDGRVGVEGAVGEGSIFWFTLPLAGPLSRPAGAAL